MTTAFNSNTNAYLRTQVMSASAEELRLMLIDGAIRFVRQGRDAVVAGDHEQSYSGFSQARAIVSELMTSMRSDVAPELCERVRSLYSFLYAELVAASLDRDTEKADRVLELLQYERETWVLLMNELKQAETASATGTAGPTGTSAAGSPAQGQTAPPRTQPQASNAPGDGYRPLSVQG